MRGAQALLGLIALVTALASLIPQHASPDVLLALFGPLFGLSASLVDASPFAAAPVPSGNGVDPRGVAVLVVVAASAALIALAGMRRRELRS